MMESTSQKRSENLWPSKTAYIFDLVSLTCRRFEVHKPKAVEEKAEEDVPKVSDIAVLSDKQIYYTSRTHTQLRQLTTELLKTSFPHPEIDQEGGGVESSGVSLVPLGSRKQLCINEKVRSLAKGGNDERMNEACLDMQKAGKLLRPIAYRQAD